MKFVLIGNYTPDRQESMRKYTINLCEQILEQGFSCEIWLPIIFFGLGQKRTTAGMAKWLGYLDKWILFPIVLRLRLLTAAKSQNIRYHICDHSNSPYLAHLPLENTGITCHDVLAIRGAMGYEDAYCPASRMGKILQSWILSNLLKAQTLTCVSQLTLNQLLELRTKTQGSEKNDISKWTVIPNAFNNHFWPMTEEESKTHLSSLGLDFKQNFILHVGSSLPRKNRKLLVDMLIELGKSWTGMVYFAGQPLSTELTEYIKLNKLTSSVVSIEKPSHDELVALYSTCEAFIFPSFSEGFGWPLIEAQACGAAVIASNIEPMPEVSNGSALHANPENPGDFAKCLLTLSIEKRNRLIEMGFENCKRFDNKLIIEKFLHLHGIMANNAAHFKI